MRPHKSLRWSVDQWSQHLSFRWKDLSIGLSLNSQWPVNCVKVIVLECPRWPRIRQCSCHIHSLGKFMSISASFLGSFAQHLRRPDMQENAHGTGLKAGIQIGCLSSVSVQAAYLDTSGWIVAMHFKILKFSRPRLHVLLACKKMAKHQIHPNTVAC